MYTVQFSTVQYSTVQYSTVLYCTVLYCTVLYCTVLFCTVLYSTVQCSCNFYIIILLSCRVLSNHSREVYEMDGMLDEQLQEAYVKQQMKVSHLLIVTLYIMSVNILAVYILMMTST